jgi:hypothetical protein
MRRYVTALEVALVAWIALWVLTGYLVDRQVRRLGKLGDTVVLAGSSIEQTAHALDTVSGLPFVGRDVGRLASSARRTARSAVVNGRQARSDVDRLALLLWITVAAGPTVPALAGYAWIRRPERTRR